MGQLPETQTLLPSGEARSSLRTGRQTSDWRGSHGSSRYSVGLLQSLYWFAPPKNHPNGQKSTDKDGSTITQESSSPNGKQEDVQFVFECGAEMISTGRLLPIDRRLGYIPWLAIAPAVNTAGSDDFSNPHHQHRFDIDRC